MSEEQPSRPWHVGIECQSGSCFFAKDKSGQRTTGPCMCFAHPEYREQKLIKLAFTRTQFFFEKLLEACEEGLYCPACGGTGIRSPQAISDLKKIKDCQLCSGKGKLQSRKQIDAIAAAKGGTE